MSTDQTNAFHKTNKMLENATDAMRDYWIHYSHAGTWQFWLLAALLITPLIILYFYLDRSKALLIGFYGLNVHVWFHYSDLFTTTHGYTNYPYKAIPFLPVSLALDTSIVPVAFMLLYQWTMNSKRNYYWYAILFSAGFTFIVKPIMNAMDLFKIYKGMNYVYLFLLYVIIIVMAKLVTDLFIYFQAHGRRGRGDRVTHRIKFSRFDNRTKAK